MHSCSICNKTFADNRGLSNHLRGGCRTERQSKLFKFCLVCNKIIKFKSKSKLEIAILNDVKCRNCANAKRTISEETREKISNTLKRKYNTKELIPNMDGCHSIESRQKMSQTRLGSKLTQEHKEKISKSINTSKKFKLAVKSKSRAEKISKAHKGKKFSDETKHKMSIAKKNWSGEENPFYGKKHSLETKTILRIKMLERREKLLIDDKIRLHPFYNKAACEYFNKLMLETNTNIQHAENGGEFYIEKLAYWVDGFDEENNIVYEYDEKHHFKYDGTLREKDLIRESEIKELLKCKFIRIKWSDLI